MMIKRLRVFLLSTVLLVSAAAQAKKPKTYTIKKGDTPAGVAARFKVPLDELYRFNHMAPGGAFPIGQTLEIPEPGEVTGSTYTVRPGDSVARISDFHGVSQDDLRAANHLKKGQPLKLGQALTIPHALRGGTGRGHVVRQGDTLGAIAKKHGVSIKSLAAANKISSKDPLELGRTLVIPDEDDDAAPTFRPKKIDTLVKSGEKVRGGIRHTVQPGQSLWIIARAYNTSGERIARANGFETTAPLNAGDKILIPGAREVVPVRTKGFSIQAVRFVSVWNNKSANLKLITNSGKINQRSRRILSELAGPKKTTKKIKLMHPRLIHMLQRVAERYPGHTIELISGYRPKKPGHPASRHATGRALDFRVQGIDRKELFNYIKQLPNVGAGYYPNSVFVHMDVREKPGLWTDYSGIGEDAQYRPDTPDPEALADAE